MHKGEDPVILRKEMEFGGWRGGEKFQKDQWGDCKQRKVGCVKALSLMLWCQVKLGVKFNVKEISVSEGRAL